MNGTSTIVWEPLRYRKPAQVWYPVTQTPLEKSPSPSLNRYESPRRPPASGKAAMETMDKLAIIMEAWLQILKDAVANYHIPPWPRVKFVLPFIADLVHFIFSFSA